MTRWGQDLLYRLTFISSEFGGTCLRGIWQDVSLAMTSTVCVTKIALENNDIAETSSSSRTCL